jgi:hypothetical protein
VTSPGRAFGVAAAGLVAAALGGGCLHVRTDADGKVTAVELKLNQAGGEAKSPATDQSQTDGAVKQAVATAPAVSPTLAIPSLSKLTGKGGGDPSRATASQLALGWHNRISYLPDPAQNGTMGPGLVGQMFLFDPNFQFAPANGKLTVEMFDDPPAATPGGRPGTARRLGGWTFDKDALRRLVTADERFGKSYALFLPWPDYKPDITRVRLTARFDPDVGYAVFATPTTVTFDTTPATGGPATDPLNPPLSAIGPPAPFPAAGGATAGPPALATSPGLNATPIPVGGPVIPGGAGLAIPPGAIPVSAGTPPGGLPPFAFTMPVPR